MDTEVGGAAEGAPGMGGVCGMSGVTGWGVTGGISLQGWPGVMGCRPGVVGWTPPAWWETGTQTAAAAGAGAFPPPTCVRVTIAARPAPHWPQK